MTVSLCLGDAFALANVPKEDEEETKRILRLHDPKLKYSRPWNTNVYLIFKNSHNKFNYKFYTGLVPWVISNLSEKGINTVIENDESLLFKKGPIFTPPEDYLRGIALRDFQINAIRSAIAGQRGILQLPARSGKTEIAAALIKYYDVPSVFVTHTSNLREQTARRFVSRGLREVGTIGGGEDNPQRTTVAMVQTISKRILEEDDRILKILSEAKLLIFDEVHHLQADTWSLVGEVCQAPHRFGLSATPFLYKKREENFGDLALTGLTGKVVSRISPSVLIKRGFLAIPKIYTIAIQNPRVFVPPKMQEKRVWNHVYKKGIVENSERNGIFLDTAEKMYNAGMKVLMLVSRKNHGRDLLKSLVDRIGCDDCIFTMGQRTIIRHTPFGVKTETWPFELVRNFLEDRSSCVVIGTQIMDEGVDLPSLDAVLILSAMRSFRLTIQRATRSMTAEEGKRSAWIVDSEDLTHYMLKHQSKKRLDILRLEYPDAEIITGEDLLFSDIEREAEIRKGRGNDNAIG